AATCPASLLDIGTGSGCIAVSAARLLPGAEVWAVDISAEALAFARRNAARSGAEVRFVQADALRMPDLGRRFEAVVSNPPYIPLSERESMRRNVTEYEPATALFVPDDDPLLFYRAIARQAHRLLAPGGRLWFEVHETFADEVAAMLRREGFADVEIYADINDKPRMVCGRMK
ncbi:MAG: peptide chain release factor N(5)-glutamine methyltransferase, partial [Alistipes sp.]|nr:peptide chain release factor N(5)-glutamine methyltransferase [Alistipes sp.]